MQKNPCYEDYTLPVYEEVQLQDKAAERSDTRVKQNERISSSFAKKTKTNVSVPLHVVVLSLLAIAMVAAIALSVYALVSSNQDMDNLMEENKELMLQLNKTKMDITRLKEDFTRIETDDLMKNMAQLVNLQSSINALIIISRLN